MQLTSALLACKNVLMQHVGLIYGNKSGGLQVSDAELQYSFDDASLETSTNDLITKLKEDGGLSLDILDNVLTSMSSLGEKTAGAILDFKSKMITIKDDSYKLVVKEYLSSSSELLEFFTELEKFLDSARQSHTNIAHAVEQCSSLGGKNGVGREEAKTISNILNNIMASNVNDHSGEKLVKKARSLLERQEEMFSKCLLEQKKLGKDQKSIHGWRKLLNYIFMGTKCLVLIVLVVMMANSIGSVRAGSSNVVADLSIKAACMIDISVFIEKADHWNSSHLEACDNELVLKNHAMNTMQKGALHCIKEMGEIKDLIGKVVNSIESLLALSTNLVNGGNIEVAITNIKCSLNKFLEKIEVLEKKTGECSSKILKAREAVLK